MVQCSLLFKKRRYLDENNMDFVMDPIPIGQDPQTSFPLYREINHSTILSQGYTDTYKQINTTDDYGFFTEFLIRPGVRKFRQENIQITVEQKENSFRIPAFMIGFFGYRPGFYNASTQDFQPIYDYFFLDRNVSMICDNTYSELAAKGPTDIETLINEADFAPLQIDELDAHTPIETSDMREGILHWQSGDEVFQYHKEVGDLLPYATVSQYTFVIVQDIIPGISIVPGRYEITRWANFGNGYFYLNLNTSQPQGYLDKVRPVSGQPDAFIFSNFQAPDVIAMSPITITNTPAALGINGTWTVTAHPVLGSPNVALVGHTPSGITFTNATDISAALALEKGITQPAFTLLDEGVAEYKESPIRDSAYISALQHTGTVTHGSGLFTSHNLISPLFNHAIDSMSFPPGIAIQAKLVVYVAVMEYETSDTESQSSILTLLPADDIHSFAGGVDLI